MTLIGHLEARVGGVGPGGGGCVYEAGLVRVRQSKPVSGVFAQQTRGSRLSHPPCLSSEATAYVGWGWLLWPGSEWHSCGLSSPPQTGQDWATPSLGGGNSTAP